MNLKEIEDRYSQCKLCPHMWGGPVLFEGVPSSICFVAEALGEHDLELGRPLIGPAGQYFNKILAAAKIDRSQVFLMNTASCRPPNNKISKVEIKNCLPIRTTLIEACNPKVIVALGSTAMKALCPKNKNAIMSTRGSVLEYNKIPVVITLHPSYLMRQEQATKDTDELGKRVLNVLKRNVLSDYLTAKRIAEGDNDDRGKVPT